MCYNNYIRNTEQTIISNPKFFWNFVKSNRKDQRIPNCITHDYTTNDQNQIPDLFANYFESVYEESDDDDIFCSYNVHATAELNLFSFDRTCIYI